MTNQNKSILYAFLATICWATVATAFKITLDFLANNILTMLFYSVLCTVLFLFINLLIKKQINAAFRITKSQITQSIIAGTLNPFLYYFVLFKNTMINRLNLCFRIINTNLTAIRRIFSNLL